MCAANADPASCSYHVPPKLSLECKDLLRRMLCPRSAERVTVSQIMEHPWVTNRGREPPLPAAVWELKRDALDLDEEIIEEMAAAGFTPDVIVASVRQNSLNQVLVRREQTNICSRSEWADLWPGR
jgi:hypothetical protein